MSLSPKLITTLKPFKKLWHSLHNLNYKTLLIILVTLISLIVIFTKFSGRAKVVEAGWWSDNWHYRQAINITAHSVGQTDVWISATIDIGSTAKAQSDYGDFRFTDSNGDLLPYIIYGAGSATVITFHIDLAAFPAGVQTLYAYYGNPSAENGFGSASRYAGEASGYTIGSYGSEEQNTSPLAYWNFDDASGTTLHDQSVNISEKGLVTWWKFNESIGTTAYDEYYLNNLTISTSTPTFTVTGGKPGGAVYFTRANRDYLAASDSPKLSITGDLTISAWIWPMSTVGTTEYTIAGKYDDKSLQNTNYKLSQIGDEIRMAIGTAYLTTTTANLTTDGWYHVTGVYNAADTSIKIYINGNVQVGTTLFGTIPSSILDGTSDFCVGCYYTTGTPNNSSFYNGYIDQVKLFSRALSPAEVAAEYGSTNGDLIGMGFGETNWTEDCARSTTNQNPLGDCLSFDSKGNQYVETNGFNTLQNQPVSFSAWIMTSGTAPTSPIVSKYDYSVPNYYGFSFYLTSGQITLGLYNGGANTINYKAGPDLRDNVWHYVTGTYTGSAINLYVDNTQIGTTQYSGGFAPIDRPFRIGYRLTSNVYYNGQIDEVKIFPYALSASQVSTEYNRGAGTALAVGIKSNDPGKSNLIGWWKMDDAMGSVTLDSSGNSHLGILGSGDSAPDWIPGKFGKSLYFNGLTDYAYVPKNVGLNTTGDITISAWVKPDSANPAGSSTIFMKGTNADATVAYRLFFMAASGKVGFQMGNGTVAIGITSGTGLAFNQWQYLTADVQGTNVSLYINSLLVGTTTFSGTRQDTSYNVGIGHQMNGDTIYGSTSYNFKGAIDNIKFYNRALTNAEIFFEYNQGQPPNSYSFDDASGTTLHDQSVANSEKGLISWWKFNEGTGTTAYDETGFSNAIFAPGTSAPDWTTGTVGTGISLNGTTDYVIAGGTSTFNFDTDQSFTIGFWMKSAVNGVTQTMIYKGDAPGWRFRARSSDQTILFQIRDNAGNDPSVSSTSNITNGNWHYVTGVRDVNADQIRMYIDGRQEDSFTDTTTTSLANSNSVLLGRPGDAYGGLLDNVKIYNRALSSAEIAAEYNSTNGDLINFGTAGTGATWPDGARSSSFQKPLGRSLSFNGSNQYVVISNSETLNPSTITLSAWIRPTAANYGNFIAKGGNSGYRIRIDNGGTITFLDRGGTNYLTSNAVLSLNNWYHIVATGDSSGLKIYINGILDKQNAVSYGGAITSNPLCIGADTINGEYFSGQIDEVKIFPYALSASEISTEYNRSAGVALGVGTDPNNPNLQVGTTSALVAWWKMDDALGSSVLDSSGNNHYGTLSPGATAPAWVPGKFGKALSFNGANPAVSVIGSTASLDFEYNNPFSIAVWIKTNAPPTNYDRYIFSKKNSGSGFVFPGYALSIGETTGRPRFQIQDIVEGGGVLLVDGTSNIADGQWHHLATTYNGSHLASGVKIYVDGVGIGTSVLYDTLSTTTIKGGNHIYIGSVDGTTGEKSFNGLLDNLKVFNKVLSAEEVAFEYGKYISNTENAFDYDSGIPPPIAYWKLNEGVGTSAYDELGTYNVGSTNLNPATEWVQGKYNDAVSFDGNNQCFYKNSGSYPHPDTITISVWVKPTDLSGTKDLISYSSVWMGVYPYYTRISGGKVRFTWGGTSSPNTDVYQTDNVVLAVGVWSHIVMTNTYGTPSAMKIYVDGQYVPGSWVQGDGTRAKFTSGSASLALGAVYTSGGAAYPCDGTASFAGIMDDVKIFDYALTPSQVIKEFGHGAVIHFGN